MEKQILKEPTSVQMIDALAAKLSDYSDPATKSSNWAAVIGYPRDRTAITQQIDARRTNHERAFCYRYNYTLNDNACFALWTKLCLISGRLSPCRIIKYSEGESSRGFQRTGYFRYMFVKFLSVGFL